MAKIVNIPSLTIDELAGGSDLARTAKKFHVERKEAEAPKKQPPASPDFLKILALIKRVYE